MRRWILDNGFVCLMILLFGSRYKWLLCVLILIWESIMWLDSVLPLCVCWGEAHLLLSAIMGIHLLLSDSTGTHLSPRAATCTYLFALHCHLPSLYSEPHPWVGVIWQIGYRLCHRILDDRRGHPVEHGHVVWCFLPGFGGSHKVWTGCPRSSQGRGWLI